MKPEWKKPWTILAWLFGKEEFQPEEGPGPGYASRIGSKGFARWLFESEEESFHEEPEIALSDRGLGGRSFFQWLFSSEGCPSQEENFPDENPSRKNL